MEVINTWMTVVLIGVLVYIAFRPGNQTSDIIHALGASSTTLTRTLSGQYAGGSY